MQWFQNVFFQISAVKRLIAYKLSFYLHNICVYLLCIYKYTHMHVYIS